jgi:hypothetical protein
MKKNLFFLILIAIPVCYVSCTKDGATGPAGAKGTSNVIYSAWFTPDVYTKTTVFGIQNFDYIKAATEITQAILDSGTVLTFGKLSGYNPVIWPTGQISQLPILLTYIQGSTQTDTWSAFVTEGSIRINFTNSINTYSSISNAHSFRYIIIPGGIPSTTKSELQLSDYHAVCVKYGIPE